MFFFLPSLVPINSSQAVNMFSQFLSKITLFFLLHIFIPLPENLVLKL